MGKKSSHRSKKLKPVDRNRKRQEAASSNKKILAALVFVAVGVGCYFFMIRPTETGHGDTAAIDASGDKTSVQKTVEASVDLPTLPGLGSNRFDAVVREVAEREDPTIDGWDSERFNEIASQQLKSIGKLLVDAKKIDAKHIVELASADIAGTVLRPTSLSEVFADKSLSVMRPDNSTTNASFQGLDGFVATLKEQAKPLHGLADLRFKFKIVRVDGEKKQRATRAYFQVSGRDSKQAIQINSIWNSTWIAGETLDKPKLIEISAENYEEIVYKSDTGSMFSDCTKSIFQNTDRFGRQLIFGIDHWTNQFDGAIARPAAGHGIAIGDVNGDGLEDVYLCQSPALPNLLLIQNRDGTVTDTAPEAGVNWLEGTRSAIFADLDNDGDQDLVAVLGGKVVIQENDGRGRFQLKSIVDSVSSLFAINAIDYDNDRDLDLFICGYTLSSGVNLDDVFANPMPFHDANNGAPNVLLRNEGGWDFKDVTNEVGLDENNMRFSYASSWEDYDNDGDLDVYVANDFGRNHLYRNDNGRFKDVAKELNVEDIGPGMSAAWGDYNNDGHPDLYVSNMFSSAGNRITSQKQFKVGIDDETKKLFQRHARGNSLFTNSGNGDFVDHSVELGVTLGRWAWGSLFVDINNDGWQDLYVTNGFITADGKNDL